MITKQKPVYYCEHCKKYRLAKWAMKKHEKGCTLNPQRDCGMCEYGDAAMDFEGLLTKFPVIEAPQWNDDGYARNKWQSERAVTFKLVQAETTCPACRLAWLRQNDCSVNYNYQTDSAEFWGAYNSEVNSHLGVDTT